MTKHRGQNGKATDADIAFNMCIKKRALPAMRTADREHLLKQ